LPIFLKWRRNSVISLIRYAHITVALLCCGPRWCTWLLPLYLFW
jgi:hypothetical protein